MICYHTIGLLYDYEDTRLVTLQDLISHIEERKELNRCFAQCGGKHNAKVYDLSEYGDRRKLTDLKRFACCPECGARINWMEIKNGTCNSNAY